MHRFIALLGFLISGPVLAVGTTFTYQGLLDDGGNPANGEYDFSIDVYMAPDGGLPVNPAPLILENIIVTDGLFALEIDLGGTVFDGADRWLSLAVRPGNSVAAFTSLQPRQALTAAPYALYANDAGFASTVAAGSIGAAQVNNSQVQLRVTDTCSGGSAINAINSNGSVSCQAPVAPPLAWGLTGNAGINPATHFIGTSDDQPLEIRVSNLRAVRYEPNAISPNIIAGSPGNSVTAGVRGATVAGGGKAAGVYEPNFDTGDGFPNEATDNYGTVSGGLNNQAGDGIGTSADAVLATVGGGFSNRAAASGSVVSGGTNNTAGAIYSAIAGGHSNNVNGDNSAIGGGSFNNISGHSGVIAGGGSNAASGNFGVVGGGQNNAASNTFGTVSGGGANTASGVGSTVSGGSRNCAGGFYSWASGYRAKVRPGTSAGTVGEGCNGVSVTLFDVDGDQGTFVWADSQNADFVSTGSNQFLVRANGGIWFGTTSSPVIGASRFIDTSTGAYLTTGGVWTNASSRLLKEAFQAVNVGDVLNRVLRLPISTWRYKAAPEGRHMGPVAEDFAGLFGLGSDDKSISTIDPSGVALAAIQGLNVKIEAENATLRKETEMLHEENVRLHEELAELRAIVEGLARKK